MNNLIFTSVNEENCSEFHRLMQQYAKKLDEHQNRTTDVEMLRKWTNRIIERQSEYGWHLHLCYSDGTVTGFLFGRIDIPLGNLYSSGFPNDMEISSASIGTNSMGR